jgi:threonine dehydratase
MQEEPLPISFNDIQAARKRIAGSVALTPCQESIPLSELTGMKISCKLDYLQRTGSFKERGACNALLNLPESQRARGVIAASAGNHALGLTYHGKRLGVPVTVVMPIFAPLIKVSNCRKLGATVILHGNTLTEARERAEGMAREQGLTYVHGFNDWDIITGQGTMGLEILEQVPDVEAIVVPIGGGGLIAGIALAVKSLRPDVLIIGVEPCAAPSYAAAVAAGKPVAVPMTATLADGLAVAALGPNSWQVLRSRVDRVVQVTEEDIALAIFRLAEYEKSIVEGAAASTLAACLTAKLPELKGRSVVLCLCGGNIDLTTLGRVIEKGLAMDGRLCHFTAVISDRPGGLAEFAAVVASTGASVKDISHDRAFSGPDIASVLAKYVLRCEG